MQYSSPTDWIKQKLGPDILSWNLSYQWLDGFYPPEAIQNQCCPKGHALPQHYPELIIVNNKTLCLSCRFKPNDIVILVYPLAGFVGAVQWVKSEDSSISVRLLDDFRQKGYSVFTHENWFWVIPTGKTEDDLAFEPEDYFGALVEQMSLPLFPIKKASKGRKKSKKQKAEEKLATNIIKSMSAKQIAELAELLKKI